VCERPVVREEERAGGVGVQPPDGNDSPLVADQADDCRAPLGVAGRGDHVRGLVQEDVGERLRLDGASVHLDPVVSLHEGREAGDLAVHPHAPGADQLLGTAPRSDSCSREVSV
jgi:hypothetical protein